MYSLIEVDGSVASIDAYGAIYLGADHLASDEVTSEIFGGNFLFKGDSVSGTYLDKAEYLGVNLLRYPGGAQTEELFNVNFPDAQVEGYNLETLSDFLSSMSGYAGEIVIVLPIKKYVNNDIPIDVATAEIANFVQRVTRGEFGDVKINTFEIGNEFHIGREPGELQVLSASDYGEYAAAFALAIKVSSEYPVDVAVQAGSHWSNLDLALGNNQDIIREFENAGALDAVDQLVFHFYAKNFDNFVEKLPIVIPQQVLDDWGSVTGRELDLFVSEWNIKSVPDKNPMRDFGLAQASALVEMVAEMLARGVDSAAVWAIQQNTMTELAGREGSLDIRIAGEMFRMLEESIVGTKMIDIPLSSLGDGQIEIHAFENDTKLVVFISARNLVNDESSFSFQLSLGGLSTNFSYAWGELLSTDNPNFKAQNFKDANAVPTITNFFPELEFADGITTFTVEFQHDYEVMKIVLLKDGTGNSPVRLVGDEFDDRLISGKGDDTIEGHAGSDFLKGRAGADEIYGGDGDDKIVGGRGEDLLSGGRGSDLIRGGPGDDKILGELGDDIVKAGKGNDVIWGGAGNDRISGGPGSDIIVGGEGKDILSGNEGADIFVFSEFSGQDRIKDFENGFDIIDILGFLFSDISQSLTEQGLTLEFGGSSVLLLNQEIFLTETDFILT